MQAFLTLVHPFLLCSAQSQKDEPHKGGHAEQPTRADDPSGNREPLPCAQVHASACSYNVVLAEGHRARHHLRRLRQHPARHFHPPHDHSQPAGWPASHLCSQVGQGSARLVYCVSKLYCHCVSQRCVVTSR